MVCAGFRCGLLVDIPFALAYYCQTELFEYFIGPHYERVFKAEKTLIAIIALFIDIALVVVRSAE
jgi:hypothetical protein